MTNRRLLLACSMGTLMAAGTASATLIDDFESYTTGNISNTSTAGPAGLGIWDPQGSSFADIFDESGNQYLGFGWDDAGFRGARRDLGPNIGSSDISTLFFRVRQIDERVDSAIGVSDLDTPNTNDGGVFGDFRAAINLVDDGNATNNQFNIQSGATTLATGLTENTWYNVWMVIDNANDTMDVYLNDGISKPTTANKLNGSPVAFWSGTANTLDRFVTSGQTTVNSGGHTTHVDDIYLNAGAVVPSLFFDDFETATVNTAIGTSGPWGAASSTAGNWIVRDENTAANFGTPNQYLDLADGSATASIRLQSTNITDAVGAVTTYSFDFYETTGGGDSDLIVGYSIDNNDLNAPGARQTVNLNNGTIKGLAGGDATDAYDLDTAYTLYMIFNDTGSSFDYDGGTILDGEAHIWLEELDSGNFVFVGTSEEQNAATVASHYRVGFRSFSAFVQTVQVDNVELSLGAAAVPEPTSLALLGLGGLLLTRRRR